MQHYGCECISTKRRSSIIWNVCVVKLHSTSLRDVVISFMRNFMTSGTIHYARARPGITQRFVSEHGSDCT